MFMYALIVEIVLLAIIHIHVYVKTYNSHNRKCHYYLRYKRTEMPQLKTGNATVQRNTSVLYVIYVSSETANTSVLYILYVSSETANNAVNY